MFSVIDDKQNGSRREIERLVEKSVTCIHMFRERQRESSEKVMRNEIAIIEGRDNHKISED